MGAIFWASLSAVVFYVWENRKLIANKEKGDSVIELAKKEASELIREAKEESANILKKNERVEEKLLDNEKKLLEREAKLERKSDDIDKRKSALDTSENLLISQKENILKKQKELDGKIEEISKLSEKEARSIFLSDIEKRYEKDGITAIEKYKKNIEANKKELARDIILRSIQQFAWDVTNEVTNTLIALPSDDIKGKLIWKEWRNITAFEKATWVALIIDDTPWTVFISAFDLFRRYVAKKSLEKLIEDGRIQPARIEEVVAVITKDADLLLKELWEKTLNDLWLIGKVPAEIVPIVGKLRFRTSYGQNILKHSIEVAIIAENLWKELWVRDLQSLKLSWLLHDIGKALDQDLEWGHPEIGGNLWRKYGLEEKVIDVIENHHGDALSISLNASIVQVADAISSVRPWARRENIELYIKRIQEMEALVQSFSWVNKAFAVSAGREVRVYVDAITVTDVAAEKMASKIASEIEKNLQYPGEVKINLIREMRVIQYAK